MHAVMNLFARLRSNKDEPEQFALELNKGHQKGFNYCHLLFLVTW